MWGTVKMLVYTVNRLYSTARLHHTYIQTKGAVSSGSMAPHTIDILESRSGCRGNPAGNRKPRHVPIGQGSRLAMNSELQRVGLLSVSQYVRGLPACSGLLIGARCLGGRFYSILTVKG